MLGRVEIGYSIAFTAGVQGVFFSFLPLWRITSETVSCSHEGQGKHAFELEEKKRAREREELELYSYTAR